MAEALRLVGGGSGDRTASGTGKPRPAAEPEALTTLVVENMHCGGCMRSVEQALLAVPGVIRARANLSAKRVTVATRTRPATAEALVAALQAAGFKASPLVAESAAIDTIQANDLLKRLGVAGFAAANVMLLSVSVWSGHASDMPASFQSMFHWLSALIALPAIAYAGKPFFASARQALAAGRLNMDVPISLGVTLATAMSLYQTVRGSEQVYFDAAITLLFFLLIGRYLDQGLRSRASGAAQNLLGMRDTLATVIGVGGATERVASGSVEIGTRVLVAAGERVPVDAEIVAGASDIDESLISGESSPRRVAAGDRIFCGTVNLTGPIEARATAQGDGTLLAEIARMMQAAEQSRGRYARLADRAARIYAPAVHILGLATFVGWMLAGRGWEPALTAAIAVLIITCPCALALAVPAVQVAATSRLFRRGVIVKAADGLERLAEVDTIVLDKTGTLTYGEPRLAKSGGVADRVLAVAASLAATSRHPYSRAIVEAARVRGVGVVAAKGVAEVPGAGLECTLDGRNVRLGSPAFCRIERPGESTATLWLRDGERPPVALHFDDDLRPDARDVVRKLEGAGYELELLSGDRAAAVGAAAAAVAIATWQAEQRPDQKIAHIEAQGRKGRRVLMIGDGLNDAPALAAGHAAMSPSSAADISQTAADVVFQGDALDPIVETLAVAKAARRLSLQNFAIAVGYNIVFVPLAMAGLVTPLIAAIAMSASSIAVTANALRLGLLKPELAS